MIRTTAATTPDLRCALGAHLRDDLIGRFDSLTAIGGEGYSGVTYAAVRPPSTRNVVPFT